MDAIESLADVTDGDEKIGFLEYHMRACCRHGSNLVLRYSVRTE
jgi:hypothetical protein